MTLWRPLVIVVLIAAGCGQPRVDAAAGDLTFLGSDQFITGDTFAGTTVGGLSAISYDPDRQLYYVISDDKSEYDPARFYTVRIPLADDRIGDVEFVDTRPFTDVAGRPDPEGIAFDHRHQVLYWSSEGDEPWIRIAGLDGSFRGEFALPPGRARPNAGLEGLTLTPSGQFLWSAMEVPGFDDGEPPTVNSGALTRITKFDVAGRVPIAQYAYPLEPITAPSGEANGLTDIVALDEDTFLVVERSHGRLNVARIYRAEVAGADDVLRRESLRDGDVAPMSKTLVADLSTLEGVPPLDNIEAITLGPILSDGRQVLILLSDNNFSAGQVTQFLAFAM